jgi:hypothetical protein
MQRICVFCGSSVGRNSTYKEAAIELGRLLTQKDLTLVYGGGNIGLMGEIAQGVITEGGKAIGIIPKFLVEKELVYDKLSEIRIVETMHERKAMMADLADAFIAMPGGFGTLEETVEVLLVEDTPEALLESLATFEMPDIDKWGNLTKI